MIRFVTRPRLSLLVWVMAGAGPAHGQSPAPTLLLESYSFDDGPTARVVLPDELEEISGLAFAPDGRLLAHQDERAILYEIDPASGAILRHATLGRRGIRGDFEGVAFAGERGFLVASDGSLIEFEPDPAEDRLEYRRVRSGLRNRCEVEGLTYESASGALLLACKTPRHRSLRGHIVVFAYSLETMTLDPEPRVFLPIEDIPGFDAGDELSPSGIDVESSTGHLLVVAARERRILEFSEDGQFLGIRELGTAHRQPEGIAIDPLGWILIADEADGETPTLSRYEPRASEAP